MTPDTMTEAFAKIQNATSIEDMKAAVAGFSPIVDEIIKKSEELAAEREVEKTKLAVIERAKTDAEAASAALKTQLAEVQSTLTALQAAQAAFQAETKFNERMTALDDTFELSDEERGLLVDEVKTLDDETFAKWMGKNKMLMKEKTKEYKKAEKEKADAKKAKKAAKKDVVDDDDDDEDAETDEEKLQEEKAKKAKAAIASVIASATTNVEPAVVSPAPDVAATASLKEQYQKAFAQGLTIGNRTIEEINKSAEQK